MMTARDLVTTALLKLGVLAEGEVATAPQAMGGLRVLNSMVDAWSLEGLLVYVIDRQTFALVSGVGTYTLGPGGQWNTTPLYGAGVKRPVQIENAWWQEPVSLVEYPLNLLHDHGDYQALCSIPMSTSMPMDVWYEPSVPLGRVFIYPTPTLPANVILYLWHPWDSAVTLDSVLTLAPGYQRLLEFQLAVDLSTEYAGTLRPDITALASEAKENVQRMNTRVPRMQTDLAGVTGEGGSMFTLWNRWLSGRA
jgi:hypothetical protein